MSQQRDSHSKADRRIIRSPEGPENGALDDQSSKLNGKNGVKPVSGDSSYITDSSGPDAVPVLSESKLKERRLDPASKTEMLESRDGKGRESVNYECIQRQSEDQDASSGYSDKAYSRKGSRLDAESIAASTDSQSDSEAWITFKDRYIPSLLKTKRHHKSPVPKVWTDSGRIMTVETETVDTLRQKSAKGVNVEPYFDSTPEDPMSVTSCEHCGLLVNNYIGERGITPSQSDYYAPYTIRGKQLRPMRSWRKNLPKASMIPRGSSSRGDVIAARIANAVEDSAISDSEEKFVYERPINRSEIESSTTSVRSTSSAKRDCNCRTGIEAVSSPRHEYDKNIMTEGIDMRNDQGSLRYQGRSYRKKAADRNIAFPKNSLPSSSNFLSGSSRALREGSYRPSVSARISSQGKRLYHSPDDYDAMKYDQIDEQDLESITPLLRHHKSYGFLGSNAYDMTEAILNMENRRNGFFWQRICDKIFIMMCFIMLLILFLIGLMWSTGQPLESFAISGISDIIVSKQRILFDINLEAVNPNIVTINSKTCDLDVFITSAHLKDPIMIGNFAVQKILKVTSPQDTASETVFLETINHLTSPLRFPSTFWKREAMESKAEVIIDNPGNKTDAMTPAQWENVIKHQFTLKVKGRIQYNLNIVAPRPHFADVSYKQEIEPDSSDSGDNRENKDDGTRKLLLF